MRGFVIVFLVLTGGFAGLCSLGFLATSATDNVLTLNDIFPFTVSGLIYAAAAGILLWRIRKTK